MSTSRAGAGVASADDGEALVLNPAGLAKSTGTTITVSAAMLSYAMEFQRRGTYDAVDMQSYPYAGQPYALAKNDPSPPLGIGSMQPVPVLAVISDLGGAVPGLHVALGFYAPNAYPFRDMCVDGAGGCTKPTFGGDPNNAPLSTRYDIVEQEAAIIAPSLGVAYRILPELDAGVRLSAASATFKSTTGVWGTIDPNYQEDIQKDGQFTIDAKDSFIPTFGIGVTYRPTPALEVAANYSYAIDIHAKGTATSQLGAGAGVPGMPVFVGPVADRIARCAPGGTLEELKACVDLALPMSAQIAGRYKFLDAAGHLKGDVELDLGWENWGKSCSDESFADGSCASPGDYRVIVDGTVQTRGPTGDPVDLLPLKDAVVHHGLQDTYAIRLGGSYHLGVGAPREDQTSNEVILRGGVGYETAAAKSGWLRADFDGAARTTLTLGAAYRTSRLEVSLGGGVILESPKNGNVGGGAEPCNPTMAAPGCGTTTREGPDPVNPVLTPSNQAENPVAQGDYKAHYTMLMLGVTTWF